MPVDEKIDLFMDELIAVCIKDEPMEKINRFISVLESTIADKVHVEYMDCTTIRSFIESMVRDPDWNYIITLISGGVKKLSACRSGYFNAHKKMKVISLDEFLKEEESTCVSDAEFDSIF